MPAPFTPQQAIAEPTYWYDRTDIPQLDQFPTLEEWQAAMEDYLAVQNATPAFQPDTATPYTRADGSTGEWRSAGVSPNSPNYGKSQAQLDAETLNRRVQWHNNGPGLGVALQNQINQGMPIIQSAYGAVDSDGTPILADPLVAMLEAMGVRPTAEQLTPRAGGGANGGDIPYNPDTPTLPKLGVGEMETGGDNPDKPRGVGDQLPVTTSPGSVATPIPPPIMGPGAGGDEPLPWAPPPVGPVDPTAQPSPPPIGELSGDGGLGQGDTGSAMAMARQLAMTTGNASTIDPRYPDWLLELNRRRRSIGRIATDTFNY